MRREWQGGLRPLNSGGLNDGACFRTSAAVLATHFARQVEGGEPASVQAILDGRRSNEAQILESYAERIVGDFDAERART